MEKAGAADIEGYLAGLPEAQRLALAALCERVRALAPQGATESVSYGVPTWKYRGRPLIYLAAAKKHLAVYGVAGGTFRFQPESPPDDEQLRAWIDTRVREIER